MEGKESQNDILRLRQLEQARHENGSTSSTVNEGAPSTSIFSNDSIDILSNGYPIEAASENN